MKSGRFRGSKIAILTFISTLLAGSYAVAQTCTVTGTSPLDWVNPGPSCVEGGNAGSQSILIVPAGFILRFDDNGDTWTGTRIEISGTVNVVASPTLNCDIIIKNGGRLNILGKLNLGSAGGCGFDITVQNGGLIDVGGTGSDRLSICGVEVMKGNGACNDCGGTNSGQCAYNNQPYCEPAGGFTGPTGYGQTGYDATLPIILSYFRVELNDDRHVEIEWATEEEKDFDHFEIQRAGKDLKFSTINTVQGAGYNTNTLARYEAMDEAPLVGINYYRLKAVDIDGSIEYFKVKSVNYNGGKKFYVTPNPTNGSAIKFATNFEPSESDRIALIDAVGNVIQTSAVMNSNFEIVPGRTLPPGTYLLQYISPNYQSVARVFVKE